IRKRAWTSAFTRRRVPGGTSPARIARASSRCSASSPTGRAASSRWTIESAFIATSVRKRRRRSVSVGRISPPRNSRIASASSCAVGRSATFEPLDQVDDLVLDLDAEPAQDRELHAPSLPAQVALHLRQAADRPADVPGELPVVDLLGPDVEAGQLVVALEVRLDRADPAEPLLRHAEPPGTHAGEGEVANRIVEVRELPVEHAGEAVLAHDEVPDAIVAVHDDGVARRRTVLAQPPEAELDRRVRLADLVELLDHSLEPRVLQERDARRRDRVDLRELVGHLQRQQPTRARELVL